MAGMTRILVGVLALAALALAACGGGGEDAGAGKGKAITEPGSVPSSTPIDAQQAVLYQIRNDVVTYNGGSGTLPAGTPTPSGTRNYTVKSGDTCGAIASSLGVTVDALLKANRTIDSGCTNLHAGDTLRVPGSTSADTPTSGGNNGGGATPKPGGRTYTVKPGDTCAGIAQSFSVSTDQLIALNGINSDCTNLHEGQVVQIPG